VRSALFVALALFAAPAAAQDGRAAFEARCASCHALDPAASGRPGPQLANLVGRVVAGDTDYDYSPALRRARARGDAWTRARLAEFLTDPEAMYPGLWMGGAGVRTQSERAALVEFLMR
jgi:cytochrome c